MSATRISKGIYKYSGKEFTGKRNRRKTMKTELKPCPFCGSTKLKLVKKRTMYRGRKAYVASIRCNCCHARGGTVTNLTIPYAVKEDVEAVTIEAWNRRTEVTEIDMA